MSVLSKLNNFLKYKEPQINKTYRFPEDENEDQGHIDNIQVGAKNKEVYNMDDNQKNNKRSEQNSEKPTDRSEQNKDQNKDSNKDIKSNNMDIQAQSQQSKQREKDATNKEKQGDEDSKSKRSEQSQKDENKKPTKDKSKTREFKKPKEVSAITEKTDPAQLKEVSKKLENNVEKIKYEFNMPTNQDVIIRPFKVMENQDAILVYVDGMASKDIINDYILRQLMMCKCNEPKSKREESDKHEGSEEGKKLSIDYIADNLLAINQITKLSEFEKIVQQILNGLCALFVDGDDQCILVESRGYEMRSVSTPQTESVVKGSHEAFIENLRTNLTLVRKIVRNKDLITEILPVGKIDNVSCAIVYIKDIANPKVVEEVKNRINNSNIDFMPGAGILEQIIEEHPFALLPQILSTERPDRTAAMLMQGHVAIITDGTPTASIVPMTFYTMMHTTEDITDRWPYGTFLRVLRFVSIVIALIVPGLYAALNLYHQEMIPTELLMSLYRTRQNTPFPIFIEILLMELSFEIIREAGVRVPGVVGQTLGIIGAIVLGEAAVSAELVSPALIIVIAVTGLCGFVVPTHSLSFGIRISRFIFTVMGALAGFYGISLTIFTFGAYHASLKSFGVPLFSPVAPKTKSWFNEVIRGPIEVNKTRPDYLNPRKRAKIEEPVRAWDSDQKGDGNS